jgi:ATPase family associated with various cellular activities (AAA)
VSHPIAPAVAPERPVASDLIATLRDKAPRVAMALAAGQMAWPAAQLARRKIRDRRTYTVKVPGSDDLYDDLHEWVLGLLPRGQQRALVAWTSRRGELMAPMAIGEKPPPPSLRLRYDGAREQAISIGGHKIMVMVTDGQGDPEERRWKPPEIVFTAASPAARDALLAEIGRVLERSRGRDRKPVTRMLNEWGDWAQLDGLPPRDLGSVVLPDGQLERITADVGRWLDAEQQYARRCIPWHRAHLYEGEPGTGKTSVARAVASHYGMDVWYLPLGDIKKDADLLRQVSRIGSRSVLLLEDIDVFHAATARDDSPDRATLSGLLNALDGIATPHGLLTVLTSNHPGALDEALVRAGRVDLTEHFGLADTAQVARLVSRWYDGRIASVPGEVTAVAPADVIEACKRHDTPATAIADLAGRRAAAIRAA